MANGVTRISILNCSPLIGLMPRFLFELYFKFNNAIVDYPDTRANIR